MDMKELQQGLQNIQQAADQPPEPWLNMDNLMQGYGNWFNNDTGLGELLLGQLRARGVDTQAATEAMLRELLQGLVDDLNMLQQQLTGFTSAIVQQQQKTQAVADAVQAAIDGQQPSPIATEITPPTGADMPVMNDIPPEQAGGEMPPPEQAGGEMPPPEQAGGEMPPPEQAGGEMPPPEPAPQGTTSDRRVKSMKQIISDRRAKIIHKVNYNNNSNKRLNTNIIAACKGGF